MKKEYTYYFFDLDGTLTQSAPGIINSVVYALGKFGITVEDKTELNKFVGPPLADAFREYYGFDEEAIPQAVTYYREYFRERGMFENDMYDGVREMLDSLKARGKHLCVATSKPEEFSVTILKHYGIYSYFDLVVGATMDGSRSKKADVIRYAREQLGVEDSGSILMIGDREHDILGAKANGLDSVGVLYGYGSHEELKAAGATYIAATPGQVAQI